MFPRRPRTLTAALAATLLLAACVGSPDADTTGTGGATSTTAASTTGSGDSGGASASSSATSTVGATTTTGSDTGGTGGTGGAGGAAACANALEITLADETAGLLYLSEGDYPFETVNAKDPQGTGPITPDHLIQLLELDLPSAIETTTIDLLFTNLLAGDDAARYQILLDTLQENLTDLTVIRVIPPSPYSAQVHVYVVGRTTCGEIAGLTTVSIET